jgi:hypothetical protein
LKEVKVAGGDVRVGAVVGTKAADCDDAYPTKRYVEAAALTGGTVGDICSSNWDGLMTELGLGAIAIADGWRLTEAPVVGTIEVWVDEVPVPETIFDGWTYDPETQRVVFHGSSVPLPGAEVHIRYEAL